MKKKRLNEESLQQVSGGAAVVEVVPEGKDMPRCFSCKSANVSVEMTGTSKTITCRDCGAVDFITL